MTKPRIVLLGLILLAFFLRNWQLADTPPGLWYDEAYNALDAWWMTQTGTYPLFFPGNNGREPMWSYLLLVTTGLLGNSTFAIRWLAALVGVLTIPILYRFALLLSGAFIWPHKLRHYRFWFALAATGWLTVSWWHIHLSRAGFRPILLPPLLILSLYFFYKGFKGFSRTTRQVPRTTHHPPRPTSHLPFALSGLFLGLTQYTYLSARLVPLIFIGLALWWMVYIARSNRQHLPQSLLGVVVTAGVALLIFAPLGLYFVNNPTAFSARTGDVIFIPANFSEGLHHLSQGLALFLGAGHALYRHHLPGRAMLGWLEILFFWIGLIWLLRPTALRYPQTPLILLGLTIMWLPALLASPPIHSLRPVGILPFYIIIVTTGLYQSTHWLMHHTPRTMYHIFPIAATILLTLTGLINNYDYFQRWANHPETYQEYNGPLVDLTQHLIERSQTHNLIIPFHLYAHPTTRYLLSQTFTEIGDGPPPALNRPTEMLILPDLFPVLYVGNIPYSSALTLLTRNTANEGQIYVSRPPRAAEQQAMTEMLLEAQLNLAPFTDKFEREIALFAPWPDSQPLTPLFETTPMRISTFNWANLVTLPGYDVTPLLAQPGQPVTLNLYWHSLTETTFDQQLFLQLVDTTGTPLNQAEKPAFTEDMYHWRPDGILPTHHTLTLPAEAPAGPYLIRLGFFDPHTGKRLPLQTDAIEPIDQIHMGLFYVTPNGNDLHQPAIPLATTFAEAIQLNGITLPEIDNSMLKTQNSDLTVTFHWTALQPTDTPQTVFLQLLNENGEVISGWDSQPLGGLYPTNHWSPTEPINDTFQLPLPENNLPPGSYRLVTGFYDFTTGQRLLTDTGANFVELSQFTVE